MGCQLCEICITLAIHSPLVSLISPPPLYLHSPPPAHRQQPTAVVKTRLHRIRPAPGTQYTGVIHGLRTIVAKEGIKGLFNGFGVVRRRVHTHNILFYFVFQRGWPWCCCLSLHTYTLCEYTHTRTRILSLLRWSLPPPLFNIFLRYLQHRISTKSCLI